MDEIYEQDDLAQNSDEVTSHTRLSTRTATLTLTLM